jgi:hypothetical protein
MVETAMTLPVLMLVLFGTLEFGLMFSRYQLLLAVATSAAREASVSRQNCNPLVVEAEVRADIASFNELGMDLSDPVLTEINMTGLCRAGRFVDVELIYHMPFKATELFMGFFTGTPITEIPMRAEVRMRIDP